MNHNVKSKLLLLLIFCMLVAGIALLGYPVVSNWLCENAAREEIEEYNSVVENEDTAKLDTMFEEAAQYNQELGGNSEAVSVASYDDLLAVTDAIAYLEVPKLGVYLPIYRDVSDEVLQKGIGHVPDSSLPVGGKSAHCILTGHSGLPAAKLFTDLDQMKEGDRFYIHVLDRILAYEVDQIKVVLPEQTEDIQIVEDKDYVTLVTCTPYGVNSHRLLVRGKRTDYAPARIKVQAPVDKETKQVIPADKLIWYGGLLLGIVLLIIVLRILFVPGRKSRKRR